MTESPRLLDGRLKIRHLALADALTTHGSLVGAAAHLHISQPALTRTLRELETIMGVPLYERGPRGVSLTIYGAAFTDYARSVLASLNQASRHISELADARRGRVTVGADPTNSYRLLDAAVAVMKSETPGVTVIVHEGRDTTLLDGVESGRLDLAVGRLSNIVQRSQLSQRRCYDEPVCLVARTGHPAHSNRSAHLRDLIEYPWLLPTEETPLRADLDAAFVRLGVAAPRDVIELDSPRAVGQLLSGSDAISPLPLLAALDDVRLAPLFADTGVAPHTVGVTLPSARPAGPATRSLLRSIAAVAMNVRATAGQWPPN